jgi:hypothetical protein
VKHKDDFYFDVIQAAELSSATNVEQLSQMDKLSIELLLWLNVRLTLVCLVLFLQLYV